MSTGNDTEALLRQIAAGEDAAVEQLFARYRTRLQRMVRYRVDRRISPRLDPSDIVQEALLAAARELPDFLANRPLPFYPWLRRLTWERLIDLHRFHLEAQRRSVTREHQPTLALRDDSLDCLAEDLIWQGRGPVEEAARREMHQRLERALLALEEQQREVLMLRCLEQMSYAEIAPILDLHENTVKLRYLAGIRRLQALLDLEHGL